jgi:monoamine oxidase
LNLKQEKIMQDFIIAGAGLSGLTAAYFLKQHEIGCTILEAQDRLGGRIQTTYGINQTPMEMGATWFGTQHQHVLQLLKELGITYFEQHDEGNSLFESFSFEAPQSYLVPSGSSSAFRIKDGTSQLIEVLAERVGKENIHLQTTLARVEDAGDFLRITDTAGKERTCKKLLIAIPPRILPGTVNFNPPLPEALNQLMLRTQTWMSGSIKFAVEYASPFWREKGFSGSVFSQAGLAVEIYDHCNFEYNRFALKGFLNGAAVNYSPEEREQKVLQQLSHYFGDDALHAISYHDKIWNDAFIASGDETFLPPHANNGHSLYREVYYNGKLFFTGTETSTLHGGYMDGAVIAARNLAARI